MGSDSCVLYLTATHSKRQVWCRYNVDRVDIQRPPGKVRSQAVVRVRGEPFGSAGDSDPDIDIAAFQA